MIFSFSFGLGGRKHFQNVGKLFPLVFFFHSENKCNNNRISKRENLESGNYFSKTFSSLETIFSHFFPIPKEEEVQKSRNIRNDLLKTNNKPNASQILQWNRD